jgi:hypothetical protein
MTKPVEAMAAKTAEIAGGENLAAAGAPSISSILLLFANRRSR